jgi:hypothetical protein
MAITNGYASLNDVKNALRIPTADTVDDVLLELSVETASRQIDDHCERVFYQQTGATRIFTPRDSYTCEIDDLVTLTTLKSSTDGDGTFDKTWTPVYYQLEPLNGVAGGISSPVTLIRAVDDFLFPVYGGEATVQVTGTFGWTSVPTAIKFATILLATRLFKRMDSPLGVAGFGDLGVVRVSRIDPDIDALIQPFKKLRMA